MLMIIRAIGSRKAMLNFEELTDVTLNVFSEAVSICLNSIPAAERQSVDTIKERVAKSKEKMFVGFLDGQVVLFGLVLPIKNSQFMVLDYLAVKEDVRGRGVGSEFINFLCKKNQNKTFVLEVEDPTNSGSEIQQRRVEFYRKNGAKQMVGVKYLVPPLQGSASTEMIIMLASSSKHTCLPGSVVKKLFLQMYWELYSRSEKDSLLQSFLGLIPSEVKIE